jgi:hypothetical protein
MSVKTIKAKNQIDKGTIMTYICIQFDNVHR